MKNEAKWVAMETDADLRLMSEVLGVTEITARVMANRGLRSKNAALGFLAPSVERLRDAFSLAGMRAAVERVARAVSGEKIMIYGDYDADGIMSTVILAKILRRAGADFEYYIPHRVDEGYGLNLAAVEKIAAGGASLIIAADNGISAVAEIAAAAACGVDVVVIDHHEPGEELPQAAAIVDPKQPDCDFPFKEMCAAGLVFKFTHALCEFLENPLADDERDELLALAAIATLCDIVDLVDENRIIVNSGLAALNANKLINPGLGSLITVRGYLAKPIEAQTVGFLIGPCLNATGRLESAALAVELLLAGADEAEKRLTLAQELVELNEARKNLTAECVERNINGLATDSLPKVLVLTDFNAHESVAGIVAGRIREMTNHPTILLTRGDGMAKGSGRSVEGYNIFEALHRHRHLFTRFGGHAMAAGLTLPEENIEELRRVLNEECTLTEDDFRPILRTDGEIPPEKIKLALSDELARLAPFGKGNAEPLFTAQFFAEKVRVIDEKNTLIFTFLLKNGRRLKGIAFGLNEHYAVAFADDPTRKFGGFHMDAAFAIETNIWNNNAEVQVRLKDFRTNVCNP